MAKILTFEKYLQTFHDWYEIDDHNGALIELLNLYCARSGRFEDVSDEDWLFDGQNKLYLDKGLCILGNVGTGKTLLLKLINSYYDYVRGDLDPYRYRTAIVPEVADDFTKKGREVFERTSKGNWFFDELCFIDETTKKPDREFAIYYGDKVLIGPKIIYDRYRVFTETGWQTHFTSNASVEQLMTVYGERAYSRLLEMNNILFLLGANRRKNRRPVLPVNRNKTVVKLVEKQEEIPAEYKEPFPANFNIDAEMEKAGLMREFKEFKHHRNSGHLENTTYDRLVKFGMPVGNWKALEAMYSELIGTDDIPQLERTCKKKAIANYYELLISEGKDSLEFPK